MSDRPHGAALVRRATGEHRRIVIVLAILLAVNVGVYAFAVYPLAQRVANIEQRDRAAEQALAAARREYDAARGALTGKERASVELAAFYEDVLPADLAGARRLTYLRLAQLAREAGLRDASHKYETVEQRDSTLTRYRSELLLTGNYDDIRAFIYQLDTAPEFVVIDDVRIGQGASDQGALELTLRLSTYYRSPPAP